MSTTLTALVPGGLVRRLSRRAFLERTAAGLVATTPLAACANSRPDPNRADGSMEENLTIYTWAEYHSPENVTAFGRANGVTVNFDIFESNEAMMAKLQLAGRGSGYDLVVPNAHFVPMLVKRGLLRRLDPSKIPNLARQDPALVQLKNGPLGDPDGTFTALKDWGSTGYIYDVRAVGRELSGWADFWRAAASPGVGGRVSVLPSPFEVAGLVFWRDGVAPSTTDPRELERAEELLVQELAPHVRAFDVYPALGVLSGEYALAQCWNGDARKAMIGAPDRVRWALGGPKTNLWIAVWAMLADAPHPEAAHAFINYVLDPEVSAREIAFAGNATGVVGVEPFLPPDLPAREAIFFTDEERTRLVPEVVNDSQQRLVDIFNHVKLAAGRA
ncbi:MAG: spermidine/putrescine ABC transporter substrate-binding protein [Vicinamibacterales bacterium]